MIIFTNKVPTDLNLISKMKKFFLYYYIFMLLFLKYYLSFI